MDKKIDAETAAILIKTMEGAKAFIQQLQESMEKRLWRKINIPCSLHEALNGLTKWDRGTGPLLQ